MLLLDFNQNECMYCGLSIELFGINRNITHFFTYHRIRSYRLHTFFPWQTTGIVMTKFGTNCYATMTILDVRSIKC